jgi:hypothetical protein
MERHNYYITDHYGDIWNEEPLPTFNQAYQFRAMIKPMMLRNTDLKIVSKVRDDKPQRERKMEKYENSEF